MAGDDESALDELFEAVRSAVLARRAALSERLERIERALLGYRRAVEGELAREFASEHGFKQPARPPLSADRAAELLEAAVQALPELAARARDGAPSAPVTKPASLPPKRAEPEAAPGRSGRDLSRLRAAAENAKIVVIGALAGRDKAAFLPRDLTAQVEWIDTEREGAHAVGNLPQRVRQGRVVAVVILDRAVQHRHTEPVMAAARDAGVPIAFAGQGGKASLARALEQIESALAK